LKILLWLKEFIIAINAQVLLLLECGSRPKSQSFKKVSFKACIDSFILKESIFVNKIIPYCLNVVGIKPKFPFHAIKFICHDFSSMSIWAIPEHTLPGLWMSKWCVGQQRQHNFVVSCSCFLVRIKVFTVYFVDKTLQLSGTVGKH